MGSLSDLYLSGYCFNEGCKNIQHKHLEDNNPLIIKLRGLQYPICNNYISCVPCSNRKENINDKLHCKNNDKIYSHMDIIYSNNFTKLLLKPIDIKDINVNKIRSKIDEYDEIELDVLIELVLKQNKELEKNNGEEFFIGTNIMSEYKVTPKMKEKMYKCWIEQYFTN